MNALTPPRRQVVAAGAIELIRLRPSNDPAFAHFDVRTPHAHLRHGRARRRPDGAVTIEGAHVVSRRGTDYGPGWVLEPKLRAEVERLLGENWPGSTDDGA